MCVCVRAYLPLCIIVIEPAEPEPPPAHSLGWVGEDDMGRSVKLVRPCWLGAGGEELVVWLVGEACLGSLVWSGVR